MCGESFSLFGLVSGRPCSLRNGKLAPSDLNASTILAAAFALGASTASPLATAQAAPLTQAQAIQSAAAPGPSNQLFRHAYYQCRVNYYVSQTGNDWNTGSQSNPWQTLQKANDFLAADGSAAGTCINVAPGTYSAGVHLTAGGNLASSTGYVAWRCQTMLACKITADGDPWHPSFRINTAYGPNYIIIDGFDLAASAPVTYGIGIGVNDNANGAPNGKPSAHHIWAVNNRIHGFGQGGIDMDEADWVFLLHNRLFKNASVTCDAQGSGISIVVPKAAPNYTLTADDQIWTPFHQVIAWNVSRDNVITSCGNASNPYNTDGNGIIMDTFNGSGVDNVLYPNQTLVAFNEVFNNGAKGIQIFRSAYVTVINNTAYNNNIDPWNAGLPRGEISNSGGFNNEYLNNVVLAVPALTTSDARCRGAHYDYQPAPCPLMANVSFMGGDSAGVTDSGNSWQNNINIGGAPPWGWGPNGNVMLGNDSPAFNCSSNKCEVNPQLSNVNVADFALMASSPAIGYGSIILGLLPMSSDAGACHHSLVRCR